MKVTHPLITLSYPTPSHNPSLSLSIPHSIHLLAPPLQPPFRTHPLIPSHTLLHALTRSARDKFKQVVNPQKKATPFAAMIARRKAEMDKKGKKGGRGGAQDSDKNPSSSQSVGTTERLSVRIKSLAAQRHFSVETSRKPLSLSSSQVSLTTKAPSRNSGTSGKTTGPITNPSTEKSTGPPPSSPTKSGKDRSSLFQPTTSSSTGPLPEERLDHVDRLIWLGLTHQVDNSDELHRKSAPTLAKRFLRVSGRGHSFMSDGRNRSDDDDENHMKDGHYKVKGKGGGVGLTRWSRKFRQQLLGTSNVNGNPDPTCLPFLQPTTDGKVVPMAGGGGRSGTSPHPLHPRTTDNKTDQYYRGGGDNIANKGGQENHSDDRYRYNEIHEMNHGHDHHNHENNNQSMSTSNNAGGQGLGYRRYHKLHILSSSSAISQKTLTHPRTPSYPRNIPSDTPSHTLISRNHQSSSLLKPLLTTGGGGVENMSSHRPPPQSSSGYPRIYVRPEMVVRRDVEHLRLLRRR